jgi:hypothetical protein
MTEHFFDHERLESRSESRSQIEIGTRCLDANADGNEIRWCCRTGD